MGKKRKIVKLKDSGSLYNADGEIVVPDELTAVEDADENR